MPCMRWVYLASVLLAAGCEFVPATGGKSLLCEDGCPAGTRCHEGLCVFNSPPAIDAIAPRTIDVDEVITLTATADDPEGDAVTFTWTHLAGPEAALRAPLTGAGLTFDPALPPAPAALGLHRFRVEARDEFMTGETPPPGVTEVEIMVVPGGSSAIFVSAAGGDDDDACGTVQAPCASLRHGLARMRQAGSIDLVLASSPGLSHRYCLDLTGSEALHGCFDPQTWLERDEQRDDCRIECSADADGDGDVDDVIDTDGDGVPDEANYERGHRLTDAAVASDVTLSLLTDFNTGFALSTVRLSGGTPRLVDVDIESPSCGSGCVAVGVLTLDSDAELEGVNISGSVSGFAPLELFVGIHTIGGAPKIQGGLQEDGTRATRAAGDGRRGVIVLNSPVNLGAQGILGIRSDVSVTSMLVEGGFGPQLAGITLYGEVAAGDGSPLQNGLPKVEGSAVRLTSFGTRELSGMASYLCSSDQEPCACDALYQACGAPPPLTAYRADAHFVGNDVHLIAGSATAGLRPCSGVALALAGTSTGAVADANLLTVDDYFSVAFGISMGDTSAPVGSVPHQVSNNVIRVGLGLADPFCDFVSGDNGFGTVSVGVAIFSDLHTELRDNDIAVAPSEAMSIGLGIFEGGGMQLERNRIAVGDPADATFGPLSAGVYAGTATFQDGNPRTTADAVLFEGNTVLPTGGALVSQGVTLYGDLRWRLSNNVIFGGLAPSATALSFVSYQVEPGSTWPEVIHNTILAGGDAARTLSSRAIFFFVDSNLGDGVPESAGFFGNNLIDLGEAKGRRYLFDNPTYADTTGSKGNVLQARGVSAAPKPLYGFNVQSAFDTAAAWQLILADASESVLLQTTAGASDAIIEGYGVPLLGQVQSAWADGDPGRQDVVLVISTACPTGLSAPCSSLATTRMRGSELGPLALAAAQDDTRSYLPHRAVRAELSGDDFDDLVFTERQSGAAAGGVYFMEADGDEFDRPKPVESAGGEAWADPSLLVRVVDDKDNDELVVVDGTSIHLLFNQRRLDASLVQRQTAFYSVTAIRELHFANLLADDFQDLVLIADVAPAIGAPIAGELFVIFDIFQAPTDFLPPAEGFGADPCRDQIGQAVTSFRGGAGWRIGLACSDAAVELFEYSDISQVFGLAGSVALPSAATQLSVARSQLAMLMLAVRDDAVSVINLGTLARRDHVVPGQIIMRDPQTGALVTDLAAIPIDQLRLADPACAYVNGQPFPATDLDLALVSPAASCNDLGQDLGALGAAKDLTGATRSVPPDPGAYEVTP